MPLYFAYGSNMDVNQLSDRCGVHIAAPLFTAKLADYRLGFTRYSRRQAGGVADIIPQPGGETWGAIFEVTDQQLTALDRAEGATATPPAYRRRIVSVTANTPGNQPVPLQDGTHINDDALVDGVVTYEVVDKRARQITPSSLYLAQLVTAACRCRLPDNYLQDLVGLMATIDTFNVNDVHVDAYDLTE